jgi:gamma-tubulin complex component 3
LECSWDKLETFIENKSVDLDSIIEAHSNYLNEITEKGFLSGNKEETLSGRLNDIFDCILKYKDVLDHLHEYASSQLAKSIYGGGTESPDKINHIRHVHQETEDHFTLQVLQFLDILKSYHDEDLRSLSTRLDYNDYYMTLEKSLPSPPPSS